MHRLFRHLLLLGFPLLLGACGDDAEPLPSYVQGLCELITDASGQAVTLVPDGDEPLRLENGGTGLVPDSIYRIQALYLKDAASATATLRSKSNVLAPRPIELAADEVMKTDAVSVVALWLGGRYINLRAGVKSGGGTHVFAFVKELLRTNADGSRTLALRLYHDANGDAAYYTREAILSCPLFGYKDLETGRDSVQISVNTPTGTEQFTAACK